MTLKSKLACLTVFRFRVLHFILFHFYFRAYLVQLFNTALTRPIRREQPSYSVFPVSALHLGPIVKLTSLTELPESFFRWVSSCLTLDIISDIKTINPHRLAIAIILSFNDVHIYSVLDVPKTWVHKIRYYLIESVNINCQSFVFYLKIKNKICLKIKLRKKN